MNCLSNNSSIGIIPSILTFSASFVSLQTLHQVLVGNGYECLEMNIPILCFGDGRDMELTLSSDTNATTPLATKVRLLGLH